MSACGDSGKVYNFECDMPFGSLYEETNEIEGFQSGRGGDTLLYTNVYGCNLKHEANAMDKFTNGYAVSYSGKITPVVIWYEPTGKTYDHHATTKVNMSEWEVVKS